MIPPMNEYPTNLSFLQQSIRPMLKKSLERNILSKM